MRTNTNIRLYDVASLQKLLNITLLHNHGYKISKIATYPSEKIPALVREIISEKSIKHHAVNAFKMAMMNFDQVSFSATYNQLLSEKSFREVFYEVFIPLLNELGLLWQTDTITPAHEHFITYLIKQKIIINTEKIQSLVATKQDKVFVLYLPLNEIHELGLMFLNYEILLHGYKTIFLGESIPTENLSGFHKHFDNLIFVTYMTVKPDLNELDEYIGKIQDDLLKDNSELWLVGRKTEYINLAHILPKTKIFSSVKELTNQL
jgi:methanogenic corrinoid protein MtbC1